MERREKREIKNNAEYKRKLNLKLIHNTVDSVNGTQEKRRKKQQRKQFFSHVVRCLRFFYGSFLIDEPTKGKKTHNVKARKRAREREGGWKNERATESRK